MLQLSRNIRGSYSNTDDNYSFFIYSVPSILAVLCYISSLNGDFVHDDIFAISKNGDVTGTSSVGQIWYHDFWGHPMSDIASHKSYRPLTTLSFRLDYQLSSGDPRCFHGTNVLLHALVTCLLAHVLLQVLQTNQLCALLSACVFAVHPIHTEAVSGIVGRADILAALFFLLSFLAYSRCTEKRLITKDDNANQIKRGDAIFPRLLPLMTSLLCALAATLCKETGITVLGVCCLYDVIKHRHGLSKAMGQPISKSRDFLLTIGFRVAPLVGTAAFILTARAWVMDFQLPVFQEEDNPASCSDSFLTRVLTYNYLLPFNGWLLLCPSVLSYDWQGGSIPLVESLADARNTLTLTFYVVLGLLAWASWRDLTGGRSLEKTESEQDNAKAGVPILPMALVLLSVPFLPASNLLFPVGFVVAERILYIPSIGFCLLVGLGASRLCSAHPRSKGHFLTGLVLLLMVLGARTWHRNKVWTTRHALFWSGIQTHPMNAKVHYNLANLCKDTGDKQGAIQHYRKAIELYPLHASYHNNLGTLLSDVQEAEFHFRKSLSIMPQHKGALVNLGNLLIDHGNRSGVTYLKTALEIDPNYISAMLSLGKAMISMEQFAEAETFIKQAVDLEPDLAQAHTYYGVLLQKTGKIQQAVNEYQQAYQLNPRNTDAMKNAATSLQLLGRYSEAEDILKRALSLEGDPDSYLMLGNLYFYMGNNLEALFAYRDAVSGAPNDTAVNLIYIKALIENNQPREAEERLARLLLRSPRDLGVLQLAYRLADQNGKTQEAIHYAKESILQAKISKPDALGSVYFDLADMYRKQSDLDKALQYFRHSVEQDPTHVKSYINIGTIYHIKKKYADAEEFYQKALSRDPHNEIATNNLRKLRKVWKNGST